MIWWVGRVVLVSTAVRLWWMLGVGEMVAIVVVRVVSGVRVLVQRSTVLIKVMSTFQRFAVVVVFVWRRAISGLLWLGLS